MKDLKVELLCPLCKETHIVMVMRSDYYDWRDGKLAQVAFPYLNTTEREELISNLCPECQETIFGE